MAATGTAMARAVNKDHVVTTTKRGTKTMRGDVATGVNRREAAAASGNAAPNKKKAPNKTAMAIQRSNALSFPRGDTVSEFNFLNGKEETLILPRLIAFHLLFRKLKLGKN